MIIIKKNTWISWIHPMRVLAAYGSSDRRISNNINGKTEKKQYNNTKFIVLDSGVASSLPLLVCASGGVLQQRAGGRLVHGYCSSVMSWISCKIG